MALENLILNGIAGVLPSVVTGVSPDLAFISENISLCSATGCPTHVFFFHFPTRDFLTTHPYHLDDLETTSRKEMGGHCRFLYSMSCPCYPKLFGHGTQCMCHMRTCSLWRFLKQANSHHKYSCHRVYIGNTSTTYCTFLVVGTVEALTQLLGWWLSTCFQGHCPLPCCHMFDQSKHRH